MNGVINLKRSKMILENKSLRVVVPLDPTKGMRYTEPMRDEDSDDELDCIYQITAQDQDWVNPTVDGRISWDCDSSWMSGSDEEIEWWKNWLHEVTTLNCNMMIISLQHMTTEVRKLQANDGATNGEDFINHYGTSIIEQKWHGASKGVLRTPGWHTSWKIRRNGVKVEGRYVYDLKAFRNECSQDNIVWAPTYNKEGWCMSYNYCPK